MGKLLRLSGREVCKILSQNGFSQVRQKGSHIIMQKRIEHST
ncbi:MAG: type II toxin-antitoxin system HicA family toxin, partial [Alphaproteobacteria bacterium]|nr:type II toxin-antitoxin system HicA family toxin [Alphaproteobacteria bacterium]